MLFFNQQDYNKPGELMNSAIVSFVNGLLFDTHGYMAYLKFVLLVMPQQCYFNNHRGELLSMRIISTVLCRVQDVIEAHNYVKTEIPTC